MGRVGLIRRGIKWIVDILVCHWRKFQIVLLHCVSQLKFLFEATQTSLTEIPNFASLVVQVSGVKTKIYKNQRSFAILHSLTNLLNVVISSKYACWGLRTYPYCNPNRLPLPPDLKDCPLIGNLFDMLVHKLWVVYEDGKTYGKTFIINCLCHK